jgi:hypothetical protein
VLLGAFRPRICNIRCPPTIQDVSSFVRPGGKTVASPPSPSFGGKKVRTARTTHSWVSLGRARGRLFDSAPSALSHAIKLCALRSRFVTFFFRCSSRPESPEEHLPRSIAGVLRLRAIEPSVWDGSAKLFAQDDGFVAGNTGG